MKVIGVAGEAGCGKSAVCGALAAREGIEWVDLDRLAWDVYRPDTPTYERLVSRFGSGILARNGEVDRSRLADIVFSDREALADLNGIVHPALNEKLLAIIGENRSRGTGILLVEGAGGLMVPLKVDYLIADLIADVAVSTGIQPAWIILEITEDAIMTDPELAVEIIERLTKKGYRFAIDGFGAGCCALTYLKKMPLSELKIEPAYVRDILTSENDDALVNAMINMAHDLGFQVSAAGVESEGILRKLRSYGCDIAQGHYVSQPFSMTDFEQWMKKSRWQVNGLAL
jgi:dephospho-CoA kinase